MSGQDPIDPKEFDEFPGVFAYVSLLVMPMHFDFSFLARFLL